MQANAGISFTLSAYAELIIDAAVAVLTTLNRQVRQFWPIVLPFTNSRYN